MQSVAHCSAQFHSGVHFIAFESIGSEYGKVCMTICSNVHFFFFFSGLHLRVLKQGSSESIERSDYGNGGPTLH